MGPLDSQEEYARLKQAIEGRPLPLALVDLDAFEANIDALVRLVASPRTLRVATKSLRSVELLRRIASRGEGAIRGVMTYTAAETAYLRDEGFSDLLLAYPTLQRADADLLARANRPGGAARVVVDSPSHLAVLDAAGGAAGTVVPVVIDMDVSLRPGFGVHLGVRRSPVRMASDVVALARAAESFRHLAFVGVLAYEAQIAGVPDDAPSAPLLNFAKRAMKSVSWRDVAERRADVARALAEAGLPPRILNGGGTGEPRDVGARGCAHGGHRRVRVPGEPSLRRISGGLALVPAAYFALQVVRVPSHRMVTCHGGGYVASGEAGASRLPIPVLPAGLRLSRLEGAGEVQTPLLVPDGVQIAPGDPVFFRHAKAGELSEHFDEYLLVRGDSIVGSARTYRGVGRTFLG